MKPEYIPYIIGGLVLIIIFIGIIIYQKTEGFAETTTTTTTTTKAPDFYISAYSTKATTTTLPIVVKKITAADEIKQRANVIFYGPAGSTTAYTVNSVSNTSEYGTDGMKKIISIPISITDDPFIIKQIYVESFGSSTDNKGIPIRISAIDNIANKVNFAGLNYNLTGGPDPRINKDLEASEIIFNRMTQNAIPAEGIYLDDVKTIFGTDLIGNRINILIGDDNVTVGNIIITGYKSNQLWKNEMITDNVKGPIDDFPANKNVLLKKIKIVPANNTELIPEGAKFRITFTNSYSNNVFTYPGPVDGMFVYASRAPEIYLAKMLITNSKPLLVFDDSANKSSIAKLSLYYIDEISPGYITQFRLENNLTDLRGSINPENICPNVQGLIDKQLDAETIVDSMEYLDKINTEKVKLSSNKENILTLMEQEEDIKKLEAMIKKIQELTERRTREADALNALQFTRQLNEVMKLRDELERRIAIRKQNTITFEIGINDADAAANQGIPDSRDVFKI